MAINAAWEGERGGEECCIEVAVEVSFKGLRVCSRKNYLSSFLNISLIKWYPNYKWNNRYRYQYWLFDYWGWYQINQPVHSISYSSHQNDPDLLKDFQTGRNIPKRFQNSDSSHKATLSTHINFLCSGLREGTMQSLMWLFVSIQQVGTCVVFFIWIICFFGCFLQSIGWEKAQCQVNQKLFVQIENVFV